MAGLVAITPCAGRLRRQRRRRRPLFGGGELLTDHFVAAVSVAAFSFVPTSLIATAIQRTMGLRVSAEDELLGLDQSQHSESADTS